MVEGLHQDNFCLYQSILERNQNALLSLQIHPAAKNTPHRIAKNVIEIMAAKVGLVFSTNSLLPHM